MDPYPYATEVTLDDNSVDPVEPTHPFLSSREHALSPAMAGYMENSSLFILPATAFDVIHMPAWGIESYTRTQLEELVQPDDPKPIYIIAQLPNGNEIAVQIPIPIKVMREFAPQIDIAVLNSGESDRDISRVLVPTPSFPALRFICIYMSEYKTVKDEEGNIKGIADPGTNPMYTYFQIAKVAESLGMVVVRDDVKARIRGLMYQPGSKKEWTLNELDFQLVMDRLDPRDNDWLREEIMESLAWADADGVLKDKWSVLTHLALKYANFARALSRLTTEKRREIARGTSTERTN